MKQTSKMNSGVLCSAARIAKPLMKLLSVVTVAAVFTQSAGAAPYATSLTNNGGVISFRLNESASSVAIIFTNSFGNTVVSNLGPKSIGLTVTNLSVPGSYTVSVTNFANPGYVSGLTIQVSGDTTNGVLATGGISTNTLRFNAPRGVAINMNPSSTNFGRVYVANGTPGNIVTNGTKTAGDGIYVLNADFSDATGQGTNARTAGITAFTNVAVVGSEEDSRSPWKLEVGEDSNLYITDYSTNSANIWVTDPAVTAGTNVLVGFGAASLGNASASANHGRIASSVIAKGSLANGDLVLYAIDSDNNGTSDTAVNHIMKFPIGAGPLPFSLFFTNITSVTNYDETLTNIVSIDYTTNIVSGITNVEAGNSPILLSIPGVTVDLAAGPDGKFYMMQNRSDGNEVGLAVVDSLDDSGASAMSPAGDGLWDKVYDSLLDSQNNFGSSVDILRLSRAVKISPDGKYLAIIRDDNQIWVMKLTNGLPDLSTRKLVANSNTTAIGRDIAFDPANNLYTVSSGQALMRVFSPGYKTIAQTSSKGTFVFTNVLPANTVSIVGTATNATEGSTDGQFQFVRSGDLSQPLTVNYTIAGTATRGLDWVTNGLQFTTNATITFAAGEATTNADIVVVNDTLGEATETVTFNLVATTNYISGGTLSATVFIADDGIDLPQVSLSARGSGSYELIPYRPAKFILSIAAAWGSDVNVVCALSGSAVAGIDYTNSVLVTNTIPAGSSSIIATVSPIDNSVINADKTIIMTLVEQIGAYSTNSLSYAGTNTLRNDDLAVAPTLFSDDFDVDHTANWLVKYNTNDVFTDIFFDYSTVGIPSAPNSVGGTTRGMKLKAHLGAYASTLVGVSVSPLNVGFTGDYRLRFDMWYNFNGPIDSTGTGSTELLFAGVGASTITTNGPFGLQARYNGGVYFAVSGDSGFGAGSTGSRDFGAYTNQSSLDPAVTSVNTWPAGTGTTVRDNANAYYAEFGDLMAPPSQVTLWPNQIRTNAPGGMGMCWHDVVITKTGTSVSWTIDGLLICTVNTTAFNSQLSTNIFFAYDDPNTGSLPDNADAIFGLIDNVRVEQLVSTNALLSSLVVTPAGTLSPVFASGINTYAATNAFANNPVTVTAGAANVNATLSLSLNGGAAIPLTNGVASLPRTLVLPTNTLAVKVISQDGSNTNNYTVNVRLQPSLTIPVLTNSYSGSAITFSWAADHTGYRLLVQTNALATGLSNNWFPVVGADVTNSITIPVSPANPSAFYKLVYP